MASPSEAAPSSYPSGISAPLAAISDVDQGGLVAILSAFALSLVLVSFPIRVYVRSKLSTYRADDYAFLCASIFAVLQASGVFYGLNKGFGKSQELIDIDNIDKIQKAAYTSDILYIVTLFFSKCSTAFLFLRLTPGKGHSIAIWTTITMCTTWAFVSIMLVAIRCNPSHPWQDTTPTCTNLLARWQFITALDIATEAALFAISVYLIWGIQMSLRSKAIVVGAFGFRLPVIALAGLRLHYLHIQIFSANPYLLGGPPAVSVTQIEIGYSILASIVPCLKNFMAAYEKPVATQNWYQHYATNTGYTHELASVASKSDMKEEKPSMSTPSVVRVEPSETEYSGGGKKGGGARILSGGLGKLRPESLSYQARISHRERDGERSSREEGETRSVDSGNSRRMIIKKGVEWSVNYDPRTGKQEES